MTRGVPPWVRKAEATAGALRRGALSQPDRRYVARQGRSPSLAEQAEALARTTAARSVAGTSQTHTVGAVRAPRFARTRSKALAPPLRNDPKSDFLGLHDHLFGGGSAAKPRKRPRGHSTFYHHQVSRKLRNDGNPVSRYRGRASDHRAVA